ncbi:MAG: ATP-binding protein [Microscillaceae bacterium]|nr:ATP-binding protein [Microscillaceae bacterium]
MTSLNKLNRGYVFALGLIAISSISSFLVINNALKQQEKDANIINTSGKQRALSQKLAQQVLSLYINQKPEDQQYIKEQIQEVMDELQAILKDLRDGNPQKNLPPLKANPHYRVVFHKIQKELDKMIHLAQLGMQEPPPDKSVLIKLIHQSEKFLIKVDYLTQSLAEDARERVINLKRSGIILLGLILSLLFVEAFLIFRPLIRMAHIDHQAIEDKNTFLQKTNTHLHEYIEELKSAEEEIRVQADELEKSNLKLDALNQKLDQIVQKRTQKLFDKNRQLQQANQELNVRNLELDSLIYRISHDLRSPLATILGLFNVLKFENDEATTREFMTLAEGEGQRMDRFIQSIINFAQSNRLQIEPEIIQIRTLIHECLKDFEKMPGMATLECQVQIQGENTPFFSDELRLKMIINNLISNAIQFQHNQPSNNLLVIKAYVKTQELYLSFWDNGVGIREECLDKIFDMFYRGSEKSRGSGLGLYIVKNTLKHLKGKIEVSTQKGIFTQFDIHLPNMSDFFLKNSEKTLKINAHRLTAS